MGLAVFGNALYFGAGFGTDHALWKLDNEIVTGDPESKPANVVVYPNPVENFLQIDGMTDAPEQFLLISTTGQTQLVKPETVNSGYRAPMQDLSPGLYILRVEAGGTILHFKFVKK